MSLRSEIEGLARGIEQRIVDSAVSTAERNRLLGFLHGLLTALHASEDPAVHAESEGKPESEKPAKPKAEK